MARARRFVPDDEAQRYTGPDGGLSKAARSFVTVSGAAVTGVSYRRSRGYDESHYVFVVVDT